MQSLTTAFRLRGLRVLPIEDPARDYPYRLWLAAHD